MLLLSQVIDDLRRQADEALKVLDIQQIRAWQNHPATVYILKELEADYLLFHSMWENGEFTASTDSGTAQSNAEALGAVDALCKVAEYIDAIGATKADIEEAEDDV